MKLFVDDVRDPVGEGFTVVRQYKQAVLLLDLLEFDFISLDYDIQDGYTGLDILKYMSDNNKYPKSQLNIHSTHSIGSVAMYKYAKEHFPHNIRITQNTIRWYSRCIKNCLDLFLKYLKYSFLIRNICW